jgi:hypothetical protein
LSYQRFSNLAEKEQLTDAEQQDLLGYIREDCSIFDNVEDARRQFVQLRTAKTISKTIFSNLTQFLTARNMPFATT